MSSEDINACIRLITENKQDINAFIEKYKPFIAACTQKVTGRYVRYGEDDELSMALSAFEKAVRTYTEDKGIFFNYAEILIKNSIIDYLRKEKKHRKLVYTEDYYLYEGEKNAIDYQRSVDEFHKNEEIIGRKQEILAFKQELGEFKISFEDMEKASPKSSKTKKICNRIILEIMKSDLLKNQICVQKQLPLLAIENKTGLGRKKFERHRKYIIGVILLLDGEYTILQEYIDRHIRIKCWGYKTGKAGE